MCRNETGVRLELTVIPLALNQSHFHLERYTVQRFTVKVRRRFSVPFSCSSSNTSTREVWSSVFNLEYNEAQVEFRIFATLPAECLDFATLPRVCMQRAIILIQVKVRAGPV